MRCMCCFKEINFTKSSVKKKEEKCDNLVYGCLKYYGQYKINNNADLINLTNNDLLAQNSFSYNNIHCSPENGKDKKEYTDLYKQLYSSFKFPLVTVFTIAVIIISRFPSLTNRGGSYDSAYYDVIFIVNIILGTIIVYEISSFNIEIALRKKLYDKFLINNIVIDFENKEWYNDTNLYILCIDFICFIIVNIEFSLYGKWTWISIGIFWQVNSNVFLFILSALISINDLNNFESKDLITFSKVLEQSKEKVANGWTDLLIIDERLIKYYAISTYNIVKKHKINKFMIFYDSDVLRYMIEKFIVEGNYIKKTLTEKSKTTKTLREIYKENFWAWNSFGILYRFDHSKKLD